MTAGGGTTPESLIRLLNDMEALRRALRLYPHDHPSIAPAENRIRAAAATFSRSGTVAVAVGPEKLFLDKAEVTLPVGAPARRLVQLVFQLGLAAIRCHFPDAHEGLVALGRKLASLREPPGENERQALLEAAPSLAGIELVPIDLSAVRAVDRDGKSAGGQGELRWADLAERLASSGVFRGQGHRHETTVRPELVLKMLDEATDVPAALHLLFSRLGESLRASSPAQRPVRAAEARAFLTELVALLPENRRRLAVECTVKELAASARDTLCEPYAGTGLLVDAVELMVVRRMPVPPAVLAALERLAQGAFDGIVGLPAGLAEKAERVAALARRKAATHPAPDDRTEALRLAWPGSTWARELAASLGEEQVRRHLAVVLKETMALWPGGPAAYRAGARLAEEFVGALDLGDLESAAALAPLVTAASAEARRIAVTGGVDAAVRALRSSPSADHSPLTAILSTLGEQAIPEILQILAEEESLGVRKRLLEVVSRHGERAIPFLMPLLDDPRWYVVRNVVFLLRRTRNPEVAGALKTRLAGADARVAEEILKALVAAEDPDWLAILMHELETEDASRARAAIAVASRIPHPEVVAALVAALGQRTGARLREPIVPDLVRALGQLRDPQALPVLRQVCELKQWRHPFNISPLRREAAAAIALLQGQEARDLAMTLAHDHDAEVAAAVRAAMRRARGEGVAK